MKIAANCSTHLSHGLVTKFVAKIHLYRYQIISTIAFPAVLTISVILILSAVPLAVLSLIRSMWIIVQTMLVVIIFFIFILNCYNGYTTLMHHIIYFRKILSETELSHSQLRFSKNKVNCYQEAGVIWSNLILIYSSSFFPGNSTSLWISDRSKPYPAMQGLCWSNQNIWRDLVYRDWYYLQLIFIHLYYS